MGDQAIPEELLSCCLTLPTNMNVWAKGIMRRMPASEHDISMVKPLNPVAAKCLTWSFSFRQRYTYENS